MKNILCLRRKVTSRQKGFFGESIAEKYLKSKRYHILKRNFYTAYGEIDIIAEDGPYLVFVEVKLRSNNSFGDILEQLTTIKQERLRKSALCFLEQEDKSTMECRFDYIALTFKGGLYQIEHIENAFE